MPVLSERKEYSGELVRMQAMITKSNVEVFTIPTDAPEADGTFAWTKTTLVLVRVWSGSESGIGYTYADQATAKLAEVLLEEMVDYKDAMEHRGIVLELLRAVRNLGASGIAAMAISAIDNALWDLRARILRVPLADLLGRVRDGIRVYGSGGFTPYTDDQLRRQMSDWAQQGFSMVKMKVGSDPGRDSHRVEVVRKAVGEKVDIFVDANGAYSVKQALTFANTFRELGVCWFEEPVSADNLAGLRQIRESAPPGMEIAAGEYGYNAWYFDRMLAANAVDVLQADATRCCGITGFLDVGALCWARNVPLSAHCGPSVHLHACCALPRAVHMEFFHDHARIERMLFDGFCEPDQGVMSPDLSRTGIGLELKTADAMKFAA
jgi:L-alanine-DL-glutamate epimerase-like enolase superfamily enzyme